MQAHIAFALFRLTARMQSAFVLASYATCSLKATSQNERRGRGTLSFSQKAQTTHLFVIDGLCLRVRRQFSHVGSTLTTVVRRFLLAFFFLYYFFFQRINFHDVGLVMSPQRAARPIEAASILAGVLFVSTQVEKKTICDVRLLAVSPQACSLFTGCTKFARIYIDAT